MHVIKLDTEKINIKVLDETAPLEAVILGIASDLGDPMPIEYSVDPKSKLHKKMGTFPLESDLRRENEAFARVFAKHGVRIYRPKNLPKENQIFARDIGFVVDNVFIKGNMGLAAREPEFTAVWEIVVNIAQEVWFPPQEVKIEGGDVFPYKNYIFVGQAARGCEAMKCNRTNKPALEYLQAKFPHKKVIPIPLYKSDNDPMGNCLHLDCAFQPVGNNDHCIVFREGFENQTDADFLVNLFGGKENCFEITKEQMYHMNSNVFSISPKVVVSGDNEKEFGALNKWLESIGLLVEKIPYSETAKMEGLLRCSTLPLRRTY